ncbi:MAG: fatty acid desaturase [Planctomycetota bacterium]
MSARAERIGDAFVPTSRRGIAYGLLLANIAVFAVTLYGALAASSTPIALGCAVLNGVSVALLFVIGHDCCHGSYLPTRPENYLVGQLCFLPSLHPFSLWALGHNRIHHGYTNLATKDYVYTPLTLDQYRSKSRLGRMVYRFHRSIAGHVSYYWAEIWWPKMWYPRPEAVGGYRRSYVRDTAIVTVWLVLLITGLIAADGPWLHALAFGFAVPMLVWGVLMSSVIYLHHTHPDVRWYADIAEWRRSAGQKESTVHILFPLGLNVIFHRIMEHNAHHMQPRIPLYELEEAQTLLAPDAREEVWTLGRHLEITRICRLFDFEHCCWRDYDGAVTHSLASEYSMIPQRGRGVPTLPALEGELVPPTAREQGAST